MYLRKMVNCRNAAKLSIQQMNIYCCPDFSRLVNMSKPLEEEVAPINTETLPATTNEPPGGGGNTEASISLALNVSAAISAEGRCPLQLVCPFCRREMTTRLEKRTNLLSTTESDQLLYLGGFLICCIVPVLVFGLLFRWSVGTLLLVVAVLLAIGSICLVLWWSMKGYYDDFVHFCSECDKELGTSNGYSELRQQHGRPS